MTLHVDVLVPTTGRASLREALASAKGAVREGEGIELHLHVQEDPLRRGPAWARNRAAERGSAPFIALLDDDDLWLPGRLRDALGVLRSRPEVALVCGDALPREGGLFLAGDPRGSGRPRTIPAGTRSHAELVRDCFVCASTVTLRRADWEALGGMAEDQPRAEDYALWLALTRDGRGIEVLPDALCRYGVGRVDAAGLSEHPAASMDALRALRRFADPAALASPHGRARQAALLAASVRSDPAHAPAALRLAPLSPSVWRSVVGGLLPFRPRRIRR